MQLIGRILRIGFFFFLGAFTTASILIFSAYLVFTFSFKDKIYPGVRITGVEAGGMTQEQVEKYFDLKSLEKISLVISSKTASVSAIGKDINLAPDAQLMAKRAFSIGRQTKNPYHNFLQIISAYQGEINLPAEVSLDFQALDLKLRPIVPLVEKAPIDAIYTFNPSAGPDKRGRVTAFKKSESGQKIDREILAQNIRAEAKKYLMANSVSNATMIILNLPLKEILPAISSSTADDMGIKDFLGRGESYFYDSIPGRVHNIALAASQVNGRLVAPGEIFSFDEAIGTVSAVFGYAKAYSIVKGKTVLDDGGGVCQVSTTLYRSLLNSGLPVLSRTAHAYRVGFYEQGGFLPGTDATVYPPSPDLTFKNDTGGWILIQNIFDETNKKLTFELFGKNDGRKVEMKGPVIVSTSPPPETIYEDDPNLPVGQMNQVDTAHYGAKVYFTRKVTRGEEILINETVYSDYVPWPARILRGTKT